MADTPTDHLRGATVAVTGASGNVGTALLRRLTDPALGVAEVRGLARRNPPAVAPYDRVHWTHTDLGERVSAQDLAAFVNGADAVVHLAWAIQPGRKPDELHRVNVDGTRRVVRAAVEAGVPHVVHVSSLGAYAPGARDRRVGEDWPTTGVPSSQYSRDKSEAERVVREVAGRPGGPTLSIVRPTLVLQPEAASEIGRYFLGPLLLAALRLVPSTLVRVSPLPLPDLWLQFVHADDVGDAITSMLQRRTGGPFNLAAEPLMDAGDIARALGTHRVPVPRALLRPALQAAFLAHLVPTEPGWLDLGTLAPALDATRARTLLDWRPRHTGEEMLPQFVDALLSGSGASGPLLRPAGGPSLDPADDPANVPSPR
jgi:nucleoside-diphosphate-sugar epimerase